MNLNVVKIGDICTTTQGVQITKLNTSNNAYEGGYRYLYIADFLSEKNLSFVDDIYDSKKVTKNDLVMANTGSPGRVFKGKDGILSNNLFKISFDLNIVDRDYLYLVLSSKIFQKSLQQQMKGGIQKHLGHKTIAKQNIPLPPLAEQKQIAAILDAADNLRQKDQQLVEHYTQLSQSLFLDMFGDSVTNPKGWNTDSLVNLTNKIGSGATPRGGKEAYKSQGISLIRSLNIHDNHFLMKDLAFIDDDQADALSNVVVENGDVLFNITGASVCRCSLVPNYVLPARVNQHVAIIRTKKETLNPSFLLFLIISAQFKQKLLALAGAGGATREALTKTQIQKLELPVPPIQLQNQFAERIEKIEQQKQQAQANLAKSNELFNSLLQKAFTGELTANKAA